MAKHKKVASRSTLTALAPNKTFQKQSKSRSVTKSPRTDHFSGQVQYSHIYKLYERGRFVARTPLFARWFALGSLAVLVATTLFWTIMSARLHEMNADQLIDGYLFETAQTFYNANFPGAHSFLMKWPLFALMAVSGNTLAVFMAATIGSVLATLAVLVYIIFRIERRPLVFGTLMLSLSSVLLLIPAQPYPGALLPVNMAMTTTRNLEYALFVLTVYAAVNLKNVRSKLFWMVVAALTIIIASDKLFVVLAVGGGLIALGWYAVTKQFTESKRSIRYIAAGALSFVLANTVLWTLGKSGITNIVNETNTSPFPVISSLAQFASGVMYGFGSLLTNFGANPIHANLIIRDIPADILEAITQPSIVAYVVNIMILGAGLFMLFKVVASRSQNDASRLSVLLAGATVAVAGVFVLTDHYYPVDARYMTISLFAVFIGAATYMKGKNMRTLHLGIVAVSLIAVLPLTIWTAGQTYYNSDAALSQKKAVTQKIAAELDSRSVNRLIGNYWDVTPVKSKTSKPLTIMPVDQCVTPRPVLNSKQWFKGNLRTSTAYLAVKDAGKDSYDGCSLERIVGSYGVPSERVAVPPTQVSDRPDVLLLFYAGGIRPPEQKAPFVAKPVSATKYETAQLVPLSEKIPCRQGTTLTVIAHQDDDLLFMNPDISRDIAAKKCMRTVYLTAGDAGAQYGYWQERELGAKAAYAEMYGVPNEWRYEAEIVNGREVRVEYLRNTPEVALVFLRLPDGNIHGQGFAERNQESLRALLGGTLPEIRRIDNGETYTKQALVDVLARIVQVDKPDQIRTLGSGDPSDGDHADHHAAGTLMSLAKEAAGLAPLTTSYAGYPGLRLDGNLSETEINKKQLTFLAYAKHDGAVCQTSEECQNMLTYGGYLARQYTLNTNKY